MFTLYDLVSRVLDSRDGFGDATNERRALRAAIWGVDQVAAKHKWTEYNTESVHLQNAPVDVTASVSTAGVVTVTAGTIPTWIEQASAKVGNRLVTVALQTSATTFTLENYAGPAVASGTLKIVHDRLVMLDEVREIYAVRNDRDRIDLTFVTPMVFRDHQTRQDGNPADPIVVTSVRVQQRGRRRTELRFSPPPVSDTTIRASYYRQPRPSTLVHDCGKVSGTEAESTLTLENSLPLALVNAINQGDLVILISANDLKPDANIGFSVTDDNPASVELDVASASDATHLLLEAALDGDITDRGGVLTHICDLPEGTEEAAAMYAEAKYMQIGEGSVGDFWQTVKMADAELRLAMEREGKLSRRETMPVSRSATYTRPETISEA